MKYFPYQGYNYSKNKTQNSTLCSAQRKYFIDLMKHSIILTNIIQKCLVSSTIDGSQAIR